MRNILDFLTKNPTVDWKYIALSVCYCFCESRLWKYASLPCWSNIHTAMFLSLPDMAVQLDISLFLMVLKEITVNLYVFLLLCICHNAFLLYTALALSSFRKERRKGRAYWDHHTQDMPLLFSLCHLKVTIFNFNQSINQW